MYILNKPELLVPIDVPYESALEMCGLATLFERRTKRCLDFAKKCIKHPKKEEIVPPECKTAWTESEVQGNLYCQLGQDRCLQDINNSLLSKVVE